MRLADACRYYVTTATVQQSPLMVVLLGALAQDLDAGGPSTRALAGLDGLPMGSAAPLRVAAALHRLVLERRAPLLALHYPSVGGTAGLGGVPAAALAVFEEQPDAVAERAALPCQTNEVGRCVPLVAGLAHVGGPVRLLEIGASAGLNLLVDAYRVGDSWGPPDSPCRLPGPVPTAVDVRIVDRAGCDPAPVDPTSEGGRLGLTASVWADQVERFERLRGALAVAVERRPTVEPAGAAAWLRVRLDEPAEGTTVVWHSVVRQYVDAAEWAEVERLCARPGVVRLAYEPVQERVADRFVLTAHSGGGAVDLAEGGGHGPPVRLLTAP